MAKPRVIPMVDRRHSRARPILKWAGGKTQLISEIDAFAPKKFGRYIEPFFGGGAYFFHLQPENSIIADSNPELVNLYINIAKHPQKLAARLCQLPVGKENFYDIRSQDWTKLAPIDAAVRTVYLNRLCFNGLFRVNKQGMFNVPYGNYTKPRIPNEDDFISVADALNRSKIVSGDYKQVLQTYAGPGDFVFLDPPYLPTGKYSDFKRYTKEQFYEEDHRDLAREVHRLTDLGCHVVLTNSNHPLVHELYCDFDITVVNSRRNINSVGSSREGKDVIVNALPKVKRTIRAVPPLLPSQVSLYPATRFMGSKSKILQNIYDAVSVHDFNCAIDAFSGSGIVSYMFKSMGKQVIANDHMAMSWQFATAMIKNNTVRLTDGQVERLLERPKTTDEFVRETFRGLYFSNSDNKTIDNIRSNITRLRNPYARAIAMSSLIRACTKRRPRGIFTYVGNRYDDGRADLQKSIAEHFVNAVNQVNKAVFDNGKANEARNTDALSIRARKNTLVYLDPPYFSPRSDNEYVRRYHFVEGLARDWNGIEIQQHTQTKKFKSYPTPFTTRAGAVGAFETLFRRFKESIVVVSYASNALPTVDELAELLGKYKTHVDVIPINHRYSFGNHGHKIGNIHNSVQEYLFVGF